MKEMETGGGVRGVRRSIASAGRERAASIRIDFEAARGANKVARPRNRTGETTSVDG